MKSFKVVFEDTTISDIRAVEILFAASAKAIQSGKLNVELLDRISEIATQINKNELPDLSIKEIHTAGMILGFYLVKLISGGAEIIMQQPDSSSEDTRKTTQGDEE